MTFFIEKSPVNIQGIHAGIQKIFTIDQKVVAFIGKQACNQSVTAQPIPAFSGIW